MLIHALLRLVHRRIRVAAVLLAGRVLAVPHVVMVLVAVLAGGGGQMGIGRVVVNCSVATVGHRIVSIGGLQL